MTSEEIQAKIQAKVDAETLGLKNKNQELLDKLAALKPIADKLNGVDLDKLIADSAALAKLQQDGDKEKGEYKKLYEKAVVDHGTETSALKQQLEKIQTEVVTMKKKGALLESFGKHKIDPLLHDIAVNSLIDQVAIDDAGKATAAGKKIDEFVKGWSESDIGKRFTLNGNSGGGGNGGAGDDIDAMAKFFDPKSPDYNLTEQAKIAKSNLPEYNRLKNLYKTNKAA